MHIILKEIFFSVISKSRKIAFVIPQKLKNDQYHQIRQMSHPIPIYIIYIYIQSAFHDTVGTIYPFIFDDSFIRIRAGGSVA